MIGRAFVFGDNIDTDALAPGIHMKRTPHELAARCLESVDRDFAGAVRVGDFVVAGANFGMGSSREQAAVSLKLLGIQAVVATSFARIFYRNAINLGLLAVVFPQARDIVAGARLRIDAEAGTLDNLDTGHRHAISPLPPHLLAMIRAGGLIPHLKLQFGASGASA